MTNPSAVELRLGKVKIIGANAYQNDGATVVYAGNVPSTSRVVSNVINPTAFRKYSSVVPGPVSSEDIGNGTATKLSMKPYAAGTFAYTALPANREFQIRNVSSKISGVANTLLVFPASDYAGRRSIHKLESIRMDLQSHAGWNYVTGAQLAEPAIHAGSFGNDHAARPTLAVPGEFVIQEGSNTPNQKDYPARQ